ncbi:MAG: amidohydrolase family protein [Candidatus Binatus sp.]|uniref:amidohydrolase family protein n=1 Tax=Candidatus Binatus sp. TaxID=2811406 RepID=UPI002723094D|nr:amidohydrolase family protein [Candidatus Binatus sp.]MDO8434286.1 amidohydrolase family protein [Candidatus Binatus sp.]
MSNNGISKSRAVREKLDHPVIDSDGHTVEFEPALLDYIKKVGGDAMVKRYHDALQGGLFAWYRQSPEQRRELRTTRPPWWALPTKNTLDRATSSMPKLLHERLDDIGLDFTVLYPTAGLFAPHMDDEETRRGVSRAFNLFHSDIFREYADRMTPVAVIPMHTPQEAIEELEFAVGKLGMKAVMMPGHVMRPMPGAQPAGTGGRPARWFDNLCFDGDYDYDPVWAKCVELKIAPTFHSGGMGWGSRTSISNYMFNHIGHFGAAGESLCKALFFGGVTRRFPTLKFAFLEGGTAWGASLYSDLVGHWVKRNGKAMENYNPANLDREMLLSLYERYGGDMVKGKLDNMANSTGLLAGTTEDPKTIDDWWRCGIERAEDIRDLFVKNFYFGCEADDPGNASAFDAKRNPFGARLRAIFSSDIGHWDVPDMTEVTEEAYELVEHGLITQEDFRDFVFTNPVELWCGMNPDFFKGTRVESDVKKALAAK